jgi:hypothetical protein
MADETYVVLNGIRKTLEDMGDGTYAERVAVVNPDGSGIGGSTADVTLLSAASATGVWVAVPRGRYIPVLSGDPDGATISIDLSLDGSTQSGSYDDIVFTEAGPLPVFGTGTCYMRGTITGGSSPSVTLTLLGGA